MQDQNTSSKSKLFVALDLGGSRWQLAFTDGVRRNPRLRSVDARDLEALAREIQLALQRLKLEPGARVVSCFEAGRDGFWLHRWLVSKGVRNIVVDPTSIDVDRRAKHRKTDKIDAKKLLACLRRYDSGELDACRIVRVPSEEDENARRLHRERGRLNKERTSLRNRIHALLATQGLRIRYLNPHSRFDGLRCWNGQPLSRELGDELERLMKRLRLTHEHRNAVDDERRRLLATSQSERIEYVRQLKTLKGVGIESAWILTMEFYGWRRFRNRGEVGALAGLVGTPFASDGTRREQGISKAGNARVRAVAVELAWNWLRYQPKSELTGWFNERYAKGGSRSRKVGIVAVARRLLVDLWHFLEDGVVPAQAELKA